MASPTLLDVAKRNASDRTIGIIEEAFQVHPEVLVSAARPIRGISYEALVRTAVPAAAFRNANEGSAIVSSAWALKTIPTYVLNPQIQADKAVADRSEDGAEAFLASEAAGVFEGAMQALGSQFYYGVNNDAKGFPGLVALHDSTNMVVDAEGTGDDTSSVWAVCWGPRRLEWVLGNNGAVEQPDFFTQRVQDGNGNPFTAYCSEFLAYPGLALYDSKAVARIKNVDAGKPLTDALLAQLIQKFPTRLRPFISAIYCSRRSLGYLQASRTATNATGAPATFPTEYQGIPLLVTDSILDTETAS